MVSTTRTLSSHFSTRISLAVFVCILVVDLASAQETVKPPPKGDQPAAGQDRPLRVLLFTGGATREYQFLRTILLREMSEKRAELCVFDHSPDKDANFEQDVPPERWLQDFPNALGKNKAGKRFMNLNDYDVIIAFDPDWSLLSVKQRELLNQWVADHAGGFIFVAGQMNAHLLSRPAGHDLSKIQSLIPVLTRDHRLHGLGLQDIDLKPVAPRPYALNFTPDAKKYPFLKLDEDAENPLAGWNGFFWNKENFKPEPGNDIQPKRGFFSAYPVERIRPGAEVVATFAGLKRSRIGDKTEAFKDQQPVIVAMPYGTGKTVYLGSGEFWRLRAYKEGYHERLWIKMARYAAATKAAKAP